MLGKPPEVWPPCATKFRLAAFYIENIICLLCKTSYLNDEVNSSLSLKLVFPVFSYQYFEITLTDDSSPWTNFKAASARVSKF